MVFLLWGRKGQFVILHSWENIFPFSLLKSHFLPSSHVKSLNAECLVSQLCLTLCDPMDYCPPGSSVHGISQARKLEWVAISSSKGSYRPRDWTGVSCIFCIGRQIFYRWATWEAPKSHCSPSDMLGLSHLSALFMLLFLLLGPVPNSSSTSMLHSPFKHINLASYTYKQAGKWRET